MIDKKKYLPILNIWYERYLECSRTQGTEEFPSSVMRFYYSLMNLGPEKLAVKDLCKKYLNESWQPHVEKIIDERWNKEKDACTSPAATMSVIKNDSIEEEIVKLYEFIIQTIQDSGIGWHSSEQYMEYEL